MLFVEQLKRRPNMVFRNSHKETISISSLCKVIVTSDVPSAARIQVNAMVIHGYSSRTLEVGHGGAREISSRIASVQCVCVLVDPNLLHDLVNV